MYVHKVIVGIYTVYTYIIFETIFDLCGCFVTILLLTFLSGQGFILLLIITIYTLKVMKVASPTKKR